MNFGMNQFKRSLIMSDFSTLFYSFVINYFSNKAMMFLVGKVKYPNGLTISSWNFFKFSSWALLSFKKNTAGLV